MVRPLAWTLAMAVALTAACSSDPRPASEASTAPASNAQDSSARVGPAVDLQGVIHRAALAFRAEQGAFAAGGSTFEAKVAGTRLVVTPRRASNVLTSRLPMKPVAPVTK